MSPVSLSTRSSTSWRLVAYTIGGALLIIALVLITVILVGQRNTALAEREQVRQDHDKIQAEILALPALRKSRDEIFLRLRERTESHLLFHRYRNYQLTARDRLLPLAAASGLRGEIAREAAPIPMPIAAPAGPKKKPAAKGRTTETKGRTTDAENSVSLTYELYPVTMTASGSYAAVVRFLRAVETENPLVTVTELAITSQPKTPEEHLISISFLWPIWKDLDLKPKVQDLIMPIIAFPSEGESAEKTDDGMDASSP